MTKRKEKRSRPREVAYKCKLRLCRPLGYQCPECTRVVFKADPWVKPEGTV